MMTRGSKSQFSRRLALWGIVTVLLAGLSGCAKHDESAEGQERERLPKANVSVISATRQSVASEVQVSGVVRARARASIATKVMGSIRSFPVALGQSVKEGDLLLEINAAEINAKVLQAEAQLKQAQRDLEREESLLDKGASTPEIVKNLKDRVAIMEATVEEAQVMRGYTEIRAPFDGTIAKKYSDVGSLASPGMPLLELVGSDGYEIEVGVPESLVAGMSIGDQFPASIPSTGERFVAELAEVSSGAQSYSRTFTAKLSIPNDVVAREGQFAKLTLNGAKYDAILLPEECVSKVGQLERIFVAEDGSARMRLVKTGSLSGGKVEILTGLDAGELVVRNSSVKLVDGQPITVAESE